MHTKIYDETRRQLEICNACRYCEGYCAVFPAVHAARTLSDADLNQLANLCHNCRGCYYACQYTAPHEFALNVPSALAEVRQESWQEFAYPQIFAKHFQRSGALIALSTVLSIALLIGLLQIADSTGGEGFYAALSHNAMIALFIPAFLFPQLSLGISMHRYWQASGGQRIKYSDIIDALRSALKMSNLAGGHGEGCNFEDKERFSRARQIAHQCIMYGFLLCFAATSAGTLLHYVFDIPAPYTLFSLPKLFGVSGGLLLTVGCCWMAVLKHRADKQLGASDAWGGEMAFIYLLGFVAVSGLVLYLLGATVMMPTLLALHLGAVFSFFILAPFTKMAHSFYRLAALLKDAQRRRCVSAS